MYTWQRASIILAILVGLVGGIALYTFVYAKGYAYLTNDSAACANCHIMNTQYDGWLKSSHRNAAQCNDCHSPHDLFGKYKTKALNGFWHSYAFTTGDFHEPIQIKETNRNVTQGACRHCHSQVTDAIDVHSDEKNQTDCIRCHQSVGHMH